MDKTAAFEDSPKADAEYESAIDNLLDEMKRIREQMAHDQREIERLRAETRVILTQMKAA